MVQVKVISEKWFCVGGVEQCFPTCRVGKGMSQRTNTMGEGETKPKSRNELLPACCACVIVRDGMSA